MNDGGKKNQRSLIFTEGNEGYLKRSEELIVKQPDELNAMVLVTG